ncbi:MAG: hypothetical protein PHN38_04235 [Sulfurospirillaceae bacterium]|nr:hypothetical protein [Sulfurospirillaceae bacterium]
MSLHVRAYLWYKFLNSLFFGLSAGGVFVLYAPLDPSIFSLGGVALAVGLLLVAKFYEKMMNLLVFYRVTFLVESVTLLIVTSFLIFRYSYISVLSIYLLYQVVFVFGNYLVRFESLTLHRASLLSLTDVAKQKGYLGGLVLSYLFYKMLEYIDITDKQVQVVYLHGLLLVLQGVILYSVYLSFRKTNL